MNKELACCAFSCPHKYCLPISQLVRVYTKLFPIVLQNYDSGNSTHIGDSQVVCCPDFILRVQLISFFGFLQVIPTPLTRLRWWRVCLDEAQMVETSTAKAAEMAARIPAVHRWCITGGLPAQQQFRWAVVFPGMLTLRAAISKIKQLVLPFSRVLTVLVLCIILLK